MIYGMKGRNCKYVSQHKAVFHHHYRSRLNPTTLERLRKRRTDDNEGHDEKSSESKTHRLTRAASGSKSNDFTSLCFFLVSHINCFCVTRKEDHTNEQDAMDCR